MFTPRGLSKLFAIMFSFFAFSFAFAPLLVQLPAAMLLLLFLIFQLVVSWFHSTFYH